MLGVFLLFLAHNYDGMFIGWVALVDSQGVRSLRSCILVFAQHY